MDILFTDQTPEKQYCIDLLDQLEADKDHSRYQEACQSTLDKIMKAAQSWRVDHKRLQALLRSQIWSGNVPGAIKVIKGGIPDRRVKPWAIITGTLLLIAGAWYVRSQI